jgi:hypothetical protein
LKKLANNGLINDLKGVLMSSPITFGEDSNGELYVATFDKIYQIVACSSDENLTLNTPISSSAYFLALNSIQSSAQILDLANVFFSSNKKIELNSTTH